MKPNELSQSVILKFGVVWEGSGTAIVIPPDQFESQPQNLHSGYCSQ